MEYQSAYKLANRYLQLLAPACDQIMIVGSVRRADPKALAGVHDIEFLIIPKVATATDLFGEPMPTPGYAPTPLDIILGGMMESNWIAVPEIARKADGEKYKKFAIPGFNYIDPENGTEKEFCLELWIVKPETWGIQAVIRTGPSTFSASFVNPEGKAFFHKASGKRLYGLMPAFYEYIPGETRIIIRSTGETVDCSTEESAIGLLGLNSSENHWIEPSERFRYIKVAK